MTPRVRTALYCFLGFLGGRIVYDYTVHHQAPSLASVPSYLEYGIGFFLTWLVIEFIRSRRKPR